MMMSQSSHSCVFSPFSFVCVLKSLSATNDTSGWIKWCWSCSFHFSKASSTAQTTPWVAKKWPNPSSCMILPLADQSRLRWKWRNMSFRASKWSIKKKQNKKHASTSSSLQLPIIQLLMLRCIYCMVCQGTHSPLPQMVHFAPTMRGRKLRPTSDGLYRDHVWHVQRLKIHGDEMYFKF